jgi:NAD(P)-dependent dehydrogenase (short-subunit alcohol dehydrogenase family)
MTIDLADQHILVTGTNRGIGLAIAQQLITSGAKVSAHYRTTSDELLQLAREFPDRLHVIQAELADQTCLNELIPTSIDRFGPLSGLVLNAGMSVSSSIDADQWEADWLKTIQVNLNAPSFLAKQALGHFQKQGGGRLVFISSRAAFRGDAPDYMAYAASKGGLVSLHRSIARGFGKQGVKSFLIAPGFVETDMAQDFVDQFGAAYVTDDLALNELTQPEHIASFTTFLLSGMADHSTGGTFDINAGSYVH